MGLRIDHDRITVLPEGRALCEAFGLDPLGTIASGALLMTLAPAEAGIVIHALAREAIDCHFIGQVVPPEQGVTLVRGHAPVAAAHIPAGRDRPAVRGGLTLPTLGYSRRSLAMGRDGLVASCHPLATLAGVETLKAGGTVADAAVATNAVLAVTQSNNCGLGGDLFCLYYEAATRRVHFLNGAGRSGSRATLDEVRAARDEGAAGDRARRP